MLSNLRLKILSRTALLLILFARLSVQPVQAIDQNPDPEPDLKSTQDLNVFSTDNNEFSTFIDISLSTQVEAENSDMSTLDDQDTTSLEYSEETTEETILTTETPCYIDAQILEYNDSSITIWVYTNINASLIGCYQNSSSSNDSYLSLLENEFEYELGDGFNELTVVCTDLLPAYEYFIELPTECAQNETLLSVITDFEELSYTANLENPYIVEVVCDPLRCIDCELRIDLVNSESDEIIERIIFSAGNTSEQMTFFYEFDSHDCLIYRLEVTLSSDLVGTANTTVLVSDKVVFSNEISIKFTSSSNSSDMRITFDFELENNWMNCIDTEAFIELLKPRDCDSSLETDSIVVYDFNTVLNQPDQDVIRLTIEDTPDKPFTYLTEYSINVQIFKKHESISIEALGFEKYKTDGYLISISDLTSTESSISFKWEKPPDCVKQPLVTCVGPTANITATLYEDDEDEKEDYTGICEGLESNYNYMIVVYSENNAEEVNTYKYFTEVAPAVIKDARFEKNKLNLILNLEVSSCDRLKLCYKNTTNSEAEFKCLDDPLNEIQPNTFLLNDLQNDGFLYANVYDFRVQTFGCGDLNCSKYSETFSNVASDLDTFYFIATPWLVPTENTFKVSLYNFNLPKENRGRMSLVCRRVGTIPVPPSIECEKNDDTWTCECINLIEGTRYNISLDNTKDGFVSRSHIFGAYYTEMAKPNLISVTFDDFSLYGRISFTQVGNYEKLEFCCKRKEIATEKYTCFDINNTTTKFGPEDLNKEQTILEFGREYDCIVRSIGTLGKNPTESDPFTARTDLDIIKLESSHPMTISDREITLTFNSTYLPSGSFGNITIQCLNLETQANTTRTCTRSAERITCTCNGGSLVPSTEYAVSLFTIKNGLYRARELYLRDVFTNPQAPRMLSCEERETSLKIYVELNTNPRINGIRLKLSKAIREEDEIEKESEVGEVSLSQPQPQARRDELSRLETERTCTYGTGGHWPGPNCELMSNQFIYNYTLPPLSPGTVYSIEVYTYYNELISTITTRRCSTLVDMPVFRSVSVISGNRLKVEYMPPQTDNCNITFYLYEKDTNKETYVPYDKFEVYKGADSSTDLEKQQERVLVTSSSIVFQRKLSSKTGVKYKVSASVFKEITDHVAKMIDYDKVHIVPFPGYLIAIIVIFGLLFLVGGPIGSYFAVKEYKKRAAKYASKTLVKPEHLKDILTEWDENQNAGCEKEWSDISKVTEENIRVFQYQLCGNEPKNLNKNRYQDILPYEHARVKLATNEEDDSLSVNNNNYIHDDYVNASFIPGLQSETKYIACQAPLDKTIKDFWRMIWERYVSVVIMLANIYEQDRCTYDEKNVKQKKKCDTYWPEELNKKELFGEMMVTLVKETVYRDFIVRKLIVETDDVKQQVTQYHYKAWPDKKFPKKESLYDFLEVIKKNMTIYDKKGPVLVHCSAGIGRTGTYLAIDPLMELIKKKKPVDIFERVVQMRKYRPKMVQNAVQYRFIYEFLAYCYERENNQPTYAELELSQMNTSV